MNQDMQAALQHSKQDTRAYNLDLWSEDFSLTLKVSQQHNIQQLQQRGRGCVF
jgi:hypothetical protein